MKEGNIWVWVEHRGGRVRQGSMEVLSKGRELSDETGRGLVAIVQVRESQDLSSQMLGLPDTVIFLEEEGTKTGPGDPRAAVEELCQVGKPLLLMASWTQEVMDWMPALAARLGRWLVSDEELASLLGGAIGASRSVVDMGWRPASEQVGKSGKTVSPELYLAFGISGVIHHIMGMDTSRVVVAVNRDPNALIFQHADYGIVDDFRELIPALIEELRRGS